MYITRLASNEIFSPSNKIHWEVSRSKDLSAPLYKCLSIVPVILQTNPNYTDPSISRFSKWFLSFSFSIPYTLTHLHQGLPCSFFHSGFPIFLPVRAIFPVHLILLDSMNGTSLYRVNVQLSLTFFSLLPAENQQSLSTHIFYLLSVCELP
jgi:hypothetical protein